MSQEVNREIIPEGICDECQQIKPVCGRYLAPSITITCCQECIMEMRAIDNLSGTQEDAREPPNDNGAWV